MLFAANISKAQDKIMVIADPHVLPQSVIATEANFDNYMSKQRKMVDLSQPIWDALVDTALAYHPALVLIPGDLTRDGEPEAHAYVSASLTRLQQAGIPTLVIPGNHDLPNTVEWESLYPIAGENIVRDVATKSYAVKALQGLTVIGIDGSDGTAGTGVLPESTLQFILAQADAAAAQGHTIIAMAHWQILEHFDQQGTLESACRFKNADALRDSLMAHGIHLVLTGHFHVNGITTFRDTTGLTTDSLVEITTGSPITYPCPYRWLTFSEDKATMTVQTDYLTAVDTIADLYTYSRDWMAEHTANMIPTLALRAWNKVDSKWDNTVVPMLQKAGLSSITINYIHDKMLPSSDSARIDITRRHLGNAAINLYLFHSDANEFERPEMGQALADSVYVGMDGMMDECFGLLVELISSFKLMAHEMAQEPVQSLVEDKTLWKSELHANVTDDLHPTLVINAPQNFEGLENHKLQITNHKYIENGRLFIQVGDQIYTATGQSVNR